MLRAARCRGTHPLFEDVADYIPLFGFCVPRPGELIPGRGFGFGICPVLGECLLERGRRAGMAYP